MTRQNAAKDADANQREAAAQIVKQLATVVLSLRDDPPLPTILSPIRDPKWEGRSTFSVQEAGEILRISRWAAYAAAKSGELPTVRIGGRKLVPRAGLERLLGVEQAQR
jgi:excisionase family DNA binding protein